MRSSSLAAAALAGVATFACATGVEAQDAIEEDAVVAVQSALEEPGSLAALAPGEPVFGQAIPFYDPSGRAMRPLHEALRRAAAGTEQARIVFYGASHVAADVFPHVIRERLQARFGDAGHGYILPARPWRGYRHLGGLSVDSSRRGWEPLRVRASTREADALGLAGLAVEGDTSSTWGRLDTGERAVSRFVIFYLQRPGGGAFDVRLDGRMVARVATAASEPGAGVHVVTTSDGAHVLEVQLRGDGPVRIFGVSAEREQPGVIVDNMGLNGARASSHLLWSEEIHREYLRRIAPSLVVLAYGTNESGDDDQPIETYETALRRVVARVRGTTPSAACLLIGPSDRPLRDPVSRTHVDRPRTHQVVEVQQRVARDFGCGFFDLVAFSGGPLSMTRWSETTPAYAQRDLIHFTLRGYQRLGEVLFDALLQGFEDGPALELPSAVTGSESASLEPAPISPARAP